MSSEVILKQWVAHGYRCIVWKASDVAYRCSVIENGVGVAAAETLISDGMDRAVSATEALAADRRRPRGSWVIDIEPITDIVLHMEPPTHIPEEPVITKRIPLATDLEVIPVTRDQASMIMDACDPPGRNQGESIDLRRPLYAIQRRNAPRKPLNSWDRDERLQMCVALSRLVRPTSISFKYAVRMLGDLSSRYKIIPGPVRGFGAEAWTAAPEHDWLTSEDFEVLRALVAAYDANPLSPKSRMSQAFWYFEYASRTYYRDLRTPLVSVALEALLSTDANQSTRHFTKRLPQLAEMIGPCKVTADDASDMWRLRSALSHGAKHGKLTVADNKTYGKMEDVLRDTLRTAITDLTFRAKFTDPAAINAAFPVPDRPPRIATCPTCGAKFDAPR